MRLRQTRPPPTKAPTSRTPLATSLKGDAGSERRTVSERTCSIGVDFGTESGRALLMDARTSEQLGVSVVRYASGVIDAELPGTGERLATDWALQDPDDWVAVLETAIPEVVQQAKVGADDVVGIGVDFTS